ncbi:DNA-binding transcriptional ArsR family regulator [Catenuloplanes nepalensis]|uniref:DNA-binding transcriptional ArsR family regulator n=1 Tax=Catenuloplanes nepalensis TaxID=587533 RepID=A0ABT9MWA1_9ACTN|nr:winged helix-turn-helix domain-containing protein [Catenuloplanes nepalensis]MDP9795660.1 DNA-binding transcriptional ArsR family regulator [Catenuloplanes nepalensis]
MGTLSIHFTSEDVARTRVARRPDPLWEIVCSLHRLQTRRGYAAYEGWHRQVRLDLSQHNMTGLLRSTLLPISPLGRYFPDFLTPGDVSSLDQGIDTIQHTDAARVTEEIRMIPDPAGADIWLDDLASGRPQAMHALGDGMRRYFEVAVAPYWTEISGAVADDRALRGTLMLDHGAGHLLDDLGPRCEWNAPVLQIHGYPMDRDMHLDGRGLLLVPSYFCWQDPIALANPELPPMLVYPAHRQRPAATVGTPDGSRRLGPLIGTTRLEVLRAVTVAATTGEISRRVGISPATASHHATVLREAGLITSRRHANLVLHQITEIGRALLEEPV